MGCGVGATVTLVAGVSTAGKSMRGRVFFTCTAGFDGGLGRTVIRVVSFFGTAGAGIAAVEASAGADGGLVGGRVGKWIRTVSRGSLGAAGDELGCAETIMCIVSFLGAFVSGGIRSPTSI